METLPAVAPANPPTPMEIIARVAEHADPDKMLKLMDLHERYENRRASVAYDRAMSRCQAELRTVPFSRRNTQTNSDYADIKAVHDACKPVWLRHGFHLAFSQADTATPGMIRFVCRVSHDEGHSREAWIEQPPDVAGIAGKVNKTMIHGIHSSETYAERKLLKMIFSISTGEPNEDTDGNHEPEYRTISEQQATTLANLIGQLPADRQAKFWPGMRIETKTREDGTIDIIESIKKLPVSRYTEVDSSLASALQPKKGGV